MEHLLDAIIESEVISLGMMRLGQKLIPWSDKPDTRSRMLQFRLPL